MRASAKASILLCCASLDANSFAESKSCKFLASSSSSFNKFDIVIVVVPFIISKVMESPSCVVLKVVPSDKVVSSRFGVLSEFIFWPSPHPMPSIIMAVVTAVPNFIINDPTLDLLVCSGVSENSFCLVISFIVQRLVRLRVTYYMKCLCWVCEVYAFFLECFHDS